MPLTAKFRPPSLAFPVVVGLALSLVAAAATAAVAGTPLPEPPAIAGVPIDFILFGLTLMGVALFHHHTLRVAVIGVVVITLFKVLFSPFSEGAGIGGLIAHLAHEWVLLANLLGLLLGFALLSKHFESSRVPAILPRYLPDDWKGGFVLLVMIFVLSSFLDNIAAALIGGTIANVVFRGKVHIGYLAAIVAASNAGGSGSVVGDTTTTMMWIAGVNPLQVFEAYVAAGLALVIFGIPAALPAAPLLADQQGRFAERARGLGARRHRRRDPAHRHRRQRRRQHALQRALRLIPVHRRGGLAGDSRVHPAASAALGGNAGRDPRQHLPACRWCLPRR